MSYPVKYYEEAQKILEKRKFDNSITEQKRLYEVKERVPEITNIQQQLASTTDRLVKIILSKSDNAAALIENLKNENLGLQQTMKALLKKNGFPEDYLDPVFSCKKCCDTGIAGSSRCSCYHDILRSIAAKELSKDLPMGLTCFESFNLKLYSDEKKESLKNRSPREIMSNNYEYCKQYAEDFHVPNESIFMTGRTGLGKTHLSLSIAKKVIEQNYSVVYGSVPDLFRKIERAHFDRNSEESETEVVNTLKDCDLLMLDDLGAEFDSQFNISCLYEILNSRLNFGRPTIVNTNLTGAELTKRYSDRISSRLYSMKRLPFYGDDIRLKKSKQGE